MKRMKIEEFDTILLKDGRQGDVMEVLSDSLFIVDIEISKEDWETIEVKIEDIDKVI